MGRIPKRFKLKSGLTKIILAVIIIVLIAAIAAAIILPKVDQSPVINQTRTITDMSGTTVQIPTHVHRIVVTCYGGATHEITALGAGDRIIGQPSMGSFPTLEKMFPGFNSSPDVGSFDDVNVEAILKLKPDLVIASVTSPKGNQKISNMGIPVVTVYTGKATIQGLYNEFQMMGEILETSDKANSLISYWDSHLKLVKDRVAAIPSEQRKKVYYMLGKTTHTNGAGWWGQEYITSAGGINVAEELGSNRDTSIEQVVKWNPDVIILSSNEGGYIPISDIQNNTQLSSITAVKNNKIYECPVGSFWWDRPSPETPLGVLWLAKTLYPDQFSDIDMKKETRDYFHTFYNYDLSDSELNTFFDPAPAPGGSNTIR
jgi:iron complex transport system substrate-binding protein